MSNEIEYESTENEHTAGEHREELAGRTDEGAPSGKDTINSPTSERETVAKQETEIDDDQVRVLPGTGGPDDVGDVEVDPADLNLSGDSIPGHPKPAAGA